MVEPKKTTDATSAVKTEAKAAAPVAEAKKAEPKAADVKKEAPKAEAKKTTAKDKAAVSEKPAKKTTTRKTTAKKTPGRKPAAKKEMTTVVKLEFGSKSYTPEDILKSAKDVWQYDFGKRVSSLTDIELYIKPEESKVYYVFNHDIAGSFDI